MLLLSPLLWLPALWAAALACTDGQEGCETCDGDVCASCLEGYALHAVDGTCNAVCDGVELDGCLECGEGATCGACAGGFLPLPSGACGSVVCYSDATSPPCGGHGSCVNRACSCAFNAKPSGSSCVSGLSEGAVASIVISVMFVVGLGVGMGFYGRMAKTEAAMERKYEGKE